MPENIFLKHELRVQHHKKKKKTGPVLPWYIVCLVRENYRDSCLELLQYWNELAVQQDV